MQPKLKRDMNGHIHTDFKIAIGERRVIMAGMTARGNYNEFVAVDLGIEADPKTFTPALIASEKRGMPGWRWLKEYQRDWDAQTGSPVFEEEWIARQRLHAIDPVERMDLHKVLVEGRVQRDSLGHTKYILVHKAKGRVKIFVRPDSIPPGDPAGSRRRRTAGIGMDVGEGVEKSDSTISVMFADIREQAATVACNTIRPGELGRLAALVGRLYNDALICCVRKMHGLTAIRSIADSGYPMIWRGTDPKKMAAPKIKDLGWSHGEATSDLLFGRWIDAMGSEDLITLRDLETIEQHRQYIYDEMGRACHQRLKSQPVAVREKHGDLVIATALAYRACIDLPKYKIRPAEQAPQNSAEGRRQNRQRKQRQKAVDGW